MIQELKDINKSKPKTSLINKHENQCTANKKKQARTIANHFKKAIGKRRITTSTPTAKTNERKFSKEEITIVIRQLKYNNSIVRHSMKERTTQTRNKANNKGNSSNLQ